MVWEKVRKHTVNRGWSLSEKRKSKWGKVVEEKVREVKRTERLYRETLLRIVAFPFR